MNRAYKVTSVAVGLAAALVAARTLPVAWCMRGATRWMAGDVACQQKLARGVAHLVLDQPLSRADFRTGDRQFNGEWLFGSYLMAGIGFSQMAIEHPELRAELAVPARQCVDRLLTAEVRAFDRETWREDPIDALDKGGHHAAYRGYLNLLLGLQRLAFGELAYADLNDRITARLIGDLRATPIGLLESYPREVYAVDNCFAIGSVGLHARVSGQNHQEVIDRWLQVVRRRCVDPDTGLLVQSVSASDGAAVDAPRGSGTALGLFALQYADPRLARELHGSVKARLSGTWCGFGAVREYPESRGGGGDIDSGPIIMGYGLSATGFAIAGARRYGDDAGFARLFATAHLCGAPVERAGRREYITGGALGNAILLAMLTTPRESVAPEGGSQ